MDNVRYKILLIEDEKLDQMAFTRMVEEQKLAYDCTVAGSVSEARSVLDSERFDIIITDYSLGDGTGLDILDSVKDIPVILVTGAGNQEVAVSAYNAGIYDYLIKDHEHNYLKTVPITIENAIKHKRTEQRLRLLSHAIVSTDDSVYITDLQNKITFVNKAFCETYGYSEEEIIGKDSSILWNDNPVPMDRENTYRAVSGWEVGFFHKHKDGREFPVSITRSDVNDENGNKVAQVEIARDISERMEIENELRTANQNLKKQNRLKKELAVGVCNQLMVSLAELKNFTSNAMAGTFGSLGPELQEHLELGDKEIDDAKMTLNNFLDILQIDGSKMKTQLSELSLRSVVAEVLRALSPLAAKKGVELEDYLPDSELAVDVDWGRIVRTLSNLTKDAGKKPSEKEHPDTIKEEIVSSELI